VNSFEALGHNEGFTLGKTGESPCLAGFCKKPARTGVVAREGKEKKVHRNMRIDRRDGAVLNRWLGRRCISQ